MRTDPSTFRYLRWLAFALAAILVAGVMSIVFIYWGLSTVTKNLTQLDGVEVPFGNSIHEMNGHAEHYALEVLKYVADPDPSHRERGARFLKQFVGANATYMRLAASDEKRSLGNLVAGHHADLVSTGESLMEKADEQEAGFVEIAELLEQTDLIIDTMQEHADLEQTAQLVAMADLEAETSEIGFWLAVYQRLRTPRVQQRVFQKLDEQQGALADARRLTRDSEELAAIDRIDGLHGQARKAIGELMDVQQKLAQIKVEFEHLQEEIDRVLVERVQPLALKSLVVPRQTADQAASRVLAALPWLVLVFVLAVSWAALLLQRARFRSARDRRDGAADRQANSS